MYAIAFDLNNEALKNNYGSPSSNNAYQDIAKALKKYGFTRQQGSVYFGDSSVNAVTCVLAVQDMTRTFPWFANSVSDIRMLRIEEDNNLMPAIQQVSSVGKLVPVKSRPRGSKRESVKEGE